MIWQLRALLVVLAAGVQQALRRRFGLGPLASMPVTFCLCMVVMTALRDAAGGSWLSLWRVLDD